MGEIKKFINEKLIIGILLGKNCELSQVLSIISKEFGEIDYTSHPVDFTYTKYYTKEMGNDIKRYFVSLRNLSNPENLSKIKIITNKIEEKFSLNKNRIVNLDPGFLSLNRLILASTKNNGRRIPLQNGIYGEITLIYINKEFQPLEWTYPDYASKEYKEILSEIRTLYKENLKQQ